MSHPLPPAGLGPFNKTAPFMPAPPTPKSNSPVPCESAINSSTGFSVWWVSERHPLPLPTSTPPYNFGVSHTHGSLKNRLNCSHFVPLKRQSCWSFLAARTSFVAKYDRSGALVWAKPAGGTSFDGGQGIATDSAGNSYVIGRLKPATFGPGEVNQTTLTAGENGDIFVAKYNLSGTLVWARCAGGTGFSFSRESRIDGAGDAYISGHFNRIHLSAGPRPARHPGVSYLDKKKSKLPVRTVSLASPAPKVAVPEKCPVT